VRHIWQGANAIQSLKAAVRHDRDIDRLLGDRDAHRQSLDNLSIVAVLLATAAFVAFAQAPSRPEAFGPANSDDSATRDAVIWLRRFFVADQLAFVLAMAVVIAVLVSSVPQMSDAERWVNAGRVWVTLASLFLLLFGAVTSGMLAFVFAAYAVYPSEDVNTDVTGLVVLAGAVMLIAALNWTASVVRLCPGWKVLRAYANASWLARWFVWRHKREIVPPLEGLDEVAAQSLSVAKTHAAVTRELLDETRAHRELTEQLLQEMQAVRKLWEGSKEGDDRAAQLRAHVYDDK
jgi:Domain of unknown function